MPTFRFRLQRLLDLSAARTQVRARELGAARAAEADAARALEDSARRRLSQLECLRGDPAEARLDLDAWEAARARYQGLREDEHAAASRLVAAQAGVTAAQGAFVQARREGAVLERLRDRRHEAWRGRQAAADQAVLDEVAARVGGEAGQGRA